MQHSSVIERFAKSSETPSLGATIATGESNGISSQQRESDYFDRVIEQAGEFNPFAERGWNTIAHRFRQMVPITRPLSLLDVGCGTGQSRRLYIDDCRTYVGIDLSAGGLSLADRKFPDSAWVRADACQMPFANGQFDVVAFSSVLHHIDDFRQALCEAWRIVRPGGHVFAFDPNLLHPAMALFRYPKSPFYLSAGVSPNERPLLPGELAAAFRDARLTSIRQRCIADIPYRAVAPRLINACLGVYNVCDRLMEVTGIARWFGSFVLTAGQKPSRVDFNPPGSKSRVD